MNFANNIGYIVTNGEPPPFDPLDKISNFKNWSMGAFVKIG
jgi:hypothetical protein